jgi:ATP-dependent protease ClpP protease subunit
MQEQDVNVANFSPAPMVDEDGSVVLFLYGGLTAESSSRLVNEILLYGNAPNIQLRIKSNGGDVDEAFALWDIIQEYNINTHLDGFGFSGGFIVFLAGINRTMGEHAKLMHHEMRYQQSGTLTTQEKTVREFRARQNKIDRLINSKLNLQDGFLHEIYSKGEDWYVDFDLAVILGIVTHVLQISEYEETSYLEIEGFDEKEPYTQTVRTSEYVPVEDVYGVHKAEPTEE